jgi:hypothetical protein
MRDFSKTRRIVIKIGTHTLTKDTGIDAAYFRRVASQVASLLQAGRQVVIVTSGAIGMGAGQLALSTRPKDMKMRQACAAIGQPLLMQEYRKAFLRHGVTVGQVLLTAEVLSNYKFPPSVLGDWDGATLYRAVGCSRCSGTGYKGRLGLYEVMVVSEAVRRLTVERKSADEISRVAEAEGMKNLREDGIDKVLQGLTSVEEIARVIV